MPTHDPSKKDATRIRSLIDTLRTRFGVIQHHHETLSENQRLEALLHEIDIELETDVPPKPSIRPSKKPEDAVMQRALLSDELRIVNLAIERKYKELREQPLDRRAEALCVEGIQKLEMRRLNLMTRLYGKDFKHYALAQ